MRKIFSTLAAFCLGLSISISIIACADDFKDPSLMGSEELQSLQEMVAQLKDVIEEQDRRIAMLEKKDVLTKIKDGDMSYSFNYDNEGRISSLDFVMTGFEGFNNHYSVSYTETGCIISGGNEGHIELTTTGNANNVINKIIWGLLAAEMAIED